MQFYRVPDALAHARQVPFIRDSVRAVAVSCIRGVCFGSGTGTGCANRGGGRGRGSTVDGAGTCQDGQED